MNSMIELFRAIKQNDYDNFTKYSTKIGFNLNQYLYGCTPLFYCIECNNEKFTLELLKNQSVDVFLKSNVNISCLEKAIENKLIKVIDVLLKRYKKADLNRVLDNNETLLTNTIKNYDEECAIALIEGNFYNFFKLYLKY